MFYVGQKASENVKLFHSIGRCFSHHSDIAKLIKNPGCPARKQVSGVHLSLYS